jgi:ATP-dependent Clp protease protease subunit
MKMYNAVVSMAEHMRRNRSDKPVGFNDKKQTGYKVIENKGEAPEIFIYEAIGDPYWDEIGAKQIADDLKRLEGSPEILIRINSPGGYVFDGITIYNLLRQSRSKIITQVDGSALSIASVIFQGGDVRRIADNGTLMIHNAWGMAFGNAREFRKYADELDLADENILKAYQRHQQADPDQIKELLDAETWMGAERAIELGLADEMITEMKIAARFDREWLNRYRYKNIPEKLAKDPEPLERSGDMRSKLAMMSQHIMKTKKSPKE